MLCCKFQIKLFSLLVSALISAFLFVPSVAAQQSKFVENLDIQGNRRLSDEEILKHIKTRSGERLDEKQLQADLQSLLKLGVFNTTQTKVFTEEGLRGGVNVIFEVMELPRIVELKFDGLRYLTDKDVLTELREQRAELKIGESYTPQKLQKTRRIITEYLSKRGFVDAKVGVSTEDVSATSLIITFVIDEQPNDDEEDCCDN